MSDVTPPPERRTLKESTGKTGIPSEKRLKPQRPRDLLGRPLSWEATNQLMLEDYDSMTLEQNHAAGLEHARAGRWFPAHEAWETAWKQARKTKDAEFFKGLSQMGAGYVHLLRGNAHGARTLWRRAASRVSRYEDGHLGVKTRALSGLLESEARRVEDGLLVPGEDAAYLHPDL
jgi:uncharacterized protein